MAGVSKKRKQKSCHKDSPAESSAKKSDDPDDKDSSD